MNVPLLCTKARVAIITLQGVLVKHTQCFRAGGAAVRNVMATADEGFSRNERFLWAKSYPFQLRSVKTARDGMHLWTSVLAETARVTCQHKVPHVVHSSAESADCRSPGQGSL